MKAAFSLVCTMVLGISADALAEVPSPGRAPIQPAQPMQPIALLPQVSLPCSGSGASDVSSRRHSIKNTTGVAIPKGVIIRWTASDKGSGNVTLTNDVPPNDTVDVNQPGQTNGYTCTAGFSPGNPDLVVKSISWSNATTASIEIRNANPFTDAKASMAIVRSFKCVSMPVASVNVQVPAIAKGGTVTVTAQLAQANADYLEATVNATNTVVESNTSNNTQKSMEFLKSYTAG